MEKEEEEEYESYIMRKHYAIGTGEEDKVDGYGLPCGGRRAKLRVVLDLRLRPARPDGRLQAVLEVERNHLGGAGCGKLGLPIRTARIKSRRQITDALDRV